MLTLQGERFTSGRSRFADRHPRFPEQTAKIYVKVEFPGIEKAWIAQVDTGAAYSVLDVDVAEALNLLDLDGQRTRLSTRLGTLSGSLIEVPMRLVADEGASLHLDAMFFVSRDWRGGTFLGYTGLLERLRVALDCPANLFYFGVEE
jgi:hypothetical protein